MTLNKPCEVKMINDTDSNDSDSYEIDCSNRGHYVNPFKINGKMLSLNDGEEHSLAKISKWNLEGNHFTDESWDDIMDVIDKSKALKCIKLGNNHFEMVPDKLFRCVTKVKNTS